MKTMDANETDTQGERGHGTLIYFLLIKGPPQIYSDARKQGILNYNHKQLIQIHISW